MLRSLHQLFLLFTLLFSPTISLGTDTNPYPELLTNGGFVLGSSDGIFSEYSKNIQFIPASTIKILTSLAAIELLGKDFRFRTEFFIDDKATLFIKGGGEPYLTSEVITAIAKELFNKNIKEISSLVLDDSSFKLTGQVNGSENSENPYDSHNSSLAVNFNSAAITIKKNGVILSDEPQTPTLPIMKEIGKNMRKGHYRININSYTLSGSSNNTLRFTAELFTSIFKREGIQVHGGYVFDKISETAKPVYTYTSEKNLFEMLRLCLKYSNNFVANQIYLAIGAHELGYPASWEKSLEVINTYINDRFQFSHPMPRVVEGSGLSRENKISAEQMYTILEQFSPYAAQLLPIKNHSYLKSGTLDGVYCYAGFFPYNSNIYPTVVLLNQEENKRDAIIKALKKELIFQVENRIEP